MHFPSYISSEFPIGQQERLQLDKRFPAAPVKVLVVNAQTLGNLMVYFDADTEARVMGAAEPHLLPERVELNGDQLVIEAKNFRQFLKHGQAEKIRLEAHVPPRTRLQVHFDAGVLFLTGGEGDVAVSGGVGEISGYSYARQMDVKLHAGVVALNNIQGQARLNLNVGGMNLEWSGLSGDEQVEAKCNLGMIDLRLPPGVTVVEERGGVFLRKTVNVPYSTYIDAQVGFGGLGTGAVDPAPVTI